MLVGAIFCPSVCGLEENGNEGLGPRLQMLLRGNGVRCSKAWTARAGLVTYCHLSGRVLSQQLQNCKRLDPLFKLLAVILI